MKGIMACALLVFAGSLTTGWAQPEPASTLEFDHFGTGFPLEGAHELTACASCHVNRQFTGTPRQCVACHSSHGTIAATAQPSQHITTSDQCGACHRSFAWTPVQRVDHLEVFGTCSSCHDGLRAPGQSPDHIPTNAECDNCHRTTTFGFARFNPSAQRSLSWPQQP